MGVVKQQVEAEVVTFSPEVISKVQSRICYHIAQLGRLSPEQAQQVFERSIVAKNLQRRPGPVVHEDPAYLAELILEKAGLPVLAE